MKRKRRNKTPPKLMTPLEALYEIKEEVEIFLYETRNRINSNKPPAYVSPAPFVRNQLSEWEQFDGMLEKIIKKTEPLTEIPGWKIGDLFVNKGIVYKITKLPTLKVVHGELREKEQYGMGYPSTCTIHVKHITPHVKKKKKKKKKKK